MNEGHRTQLLWNLQTLVDKDYVQFYDTMLDYYRFCVNEEEDALNMWFECFPILNRMPSEILANLEVQASIAHLKALEAGTFADIEEIDALAVFCSYKWSNLYRCDGDDLVMDIGARYNPFQLKALNDSRFFTTSEPVKFVSTGADKNLVGNLCSYYRYCCVTANPEGAWSQLFLYPRYLAESTVQYLREIAASTSRVTSMLACLSFLKQTFIPESAICA